VRLLLVLTLLFPLPVLAASRAGFGFSQGIANFNGDLGYAGKSTVSLLQLHYLSGIEADSVLSQALYGIDLGISFEVLSSSAVHNGVFPFGSGEHLRLLGFLLMPTICALTSAPVQICASLGLGTVNMNGAQNRQDYGSWNYQLAINYGFYKGLALRGAVKYVGQVEQTAAGNPSEFGFTSWLFGLSWLLPL
jgi:hypothetical protein